MPRHLLFSKVSHSPASEASISGASDNESSLDDELHLLQQTSTRYRPKLPQLEKLQLKSAPVPKMQRKRSIMYYHETATALPEMCRSRRCTLRRNRDDVCIDADGVSCRDGCQSKRAEAEFWLTLKELNRVQHQSNEKEPLGMQTGVRLITELGM
eukprot:IDg14339t1